MCERVKERGIDEQWGKYTRYFYDQMDGGTEFFRRLFRKEVCSYVSDACVKWRSG